VTAYRPWRIEHVHLERTIPDLPHDRGIGGVYAVYWWRDLPLGLERIVPAELPLSGHEVRERALRTIAPAVARGLASQRPSAPGRAMEPIWKDERPLGALQRHVDAGAAAARGLTASVVICTRDRPELLARCLQSLTPALDPADDIVVVDNAPSSQATRQRVRDWPRVRYVLEPRPGLDIARNRGIRESRGELVVYCDDDVVVESSWLRRLKAPFLDPDVGSVMGLVLPAALDTEAQYVFETYWGFNRGFVARDYGREFFREHIHRGAPVWEIGAGASMALRRNALSAVGGFDERLDAGAAGCSGDSEMWYRILAAGHTCRYEPTAVSYHLHRQEMSELERQIFHYMRGHTAALLIQYEQHGHWGNLRRALCTMPAYYARKMLRRSLGSDPLRLQTLPQEIKGWLAGIRYYLAQPRRRPPVVVDGDPHSVPIP
jgi:GT2 family glycosyltransferase